jgi:hypothetical protein
MNAASSVVDATFVSVFPRTVIAEVKSKTPLETYICRWSLDSNIRQKARGNGIGMSESDHQVAKGERTTRRVNSQAA